MNKKQKEKASPAKETPLSNPKVTIEKMPSQEELWDICKQLALNQKLKESIRERIRQRDYAGSTIPVEANILMISSRLLNRPMNGANISQSSSGKTKALETALAFFPKTAYYKVDAGSERILIYSEESFEHKTVIFSEADSLPEDGPGAAALRAIISDNKMSYEYVAKTNKKKEELFTTKRIEKQGPTNCITTSTKPLPEQLSTRMLCMTIDDSPDQTRAIMRAIAQRVNNPAKKLPNETDFIALQEYIERFGNKRIYIHIASELAECIPSDQVRMRRDFEQFLTAIQASALLHQYQRESDEQGRIIATCDDYQYAIEVFGVLFEELAVENVPKHIRETVEAVKELGGDMEPVTTKQIMEHLKIQSRNTINYRVKRALAADLLINQNEGKRPYKLIVGSSLPEDRAVIPSVEEIKTCKGYGKCPYHQPESSSTLGQAKEPDNVLLSYENRENTQKPNQLEETLEVFADSIVEMPIDEMPLF